jgi:hypothetical protein
VRHGWRRHGLILFAVALAGAVWAVSSSFPEPSPPDVRGELAREDAPHDPLELYAPARLEGRGRPEPPSPPPAPEAPSWGDVMKELQDATPHAVTVAIPEEGLDGSARFPQRPGVVDPALGDPGLRARIDRSLVLSSLSL